MDRIEHLREHLAALVSYGKGDSPEAETVRAEIGLIEAQDAATTAVRDLADARQEAGALAAGGVVGVVDGIVTVGEDGPAPTVVPRRKRGQ